jgi:hypothetical protein
LKPRPISILEFAGLAFWIALGGLRLLDAWQNAHIIPALLAAQSGLVAWLLVTRGRQAVEARWLQKLSLGFGFPWRCASSKKRRLGKS